MSFDYIETRLTQAPTGVAGHMMIDISDDEGDLRPARDACLWMTAKQEEKLKPEQILAPLVGETHIFTEHVFFKLCLLLLYTNSMGMNSAFLKRYLIIFILEMSI